MNGKITMGKKVFPLMSCNHANILSTIRIATFPATRSTTARWYTIVCGDAHLGLALDLARLDAYGEGGEECMLRDRLLRRYLRFSSLC